MNTLVLTPGEPSHRTFLGQADSLPSHSCLGGSICLVPLDGLPSAEMSL